MGRGKWGLHVGGGGGGRSHPGLDSLILCGAPWESKRGDSGQKFPAAPPACCNVAQRAPLQDDAGRAKAPGCVRKDPAQATHFASVQVVRRREPSYDGVLFLHSAHGFLGFGTAGGWRTTRLGLTPPDGNEDRRGACSPTLPQIRKLGRLWGTRVEFWVRTGEDLGMVSELLPRVRSTI